MASAHSEFSHTIKLVWFNKLACVGRTTEGEGGSVCVCACAQLR